VWGYDFVMDRTSDGRPIRMLTIVDEFTRECLAIDVAKKLTSEDVLERLSDLFVRRGVPEHIRSDNGSEFTAKCVREWLGRVGVKTLYIEPGSPWENSYVESFNGKLRDELLKRESFDTLLEAKVLIERWRQAYNTVRPHSSPGVSAPGSRGAAALCGRFGYASATAQGWSIRRGIPNSKAGIALGDRSHFGGADPPLVGLEKLSRPSLRKGGRRPQCQSHYQGNPEANLGEVAHSLRLGRLLVAVHCGDKYKHRQWSEEAAKQPRCRARGSA
jgi:hypothetical protein